MLTWLPGRRALRHRTPAMLSAIGALAARLHNHAERYAPPPSFRRRRFDLAGLTGREGRFGPAWELLAPHQRALFEEVSRRLAAVTGRLGAGRQVFGLIHGDLNFHNVLFNRGSLALIDFDDCGFGWYLYDLATTLDFLEGRPRYEELRVALVAGYRQVRPLSDYEERSLTLFLLARWVFLGLSFLSRPDHAPFREYTARFFQVVEPKIERCLGEFSMKGLAAVTAKPAMTIPCR